MVSEPKVSEPVRNHSWTTVEEIHPYSDAKPALEHKLTDWSSIDALICQHMLTAISHAEIFDIKATCPPRLILGDGFLNHYLAMPCKEGNCSQLPHVSTTDLSWDSS